MWQDTRSTKKNQYPSSIQETDKEIKETSPFTIATNNIKYLWVTQIKEVKDLFDKNFKSLKKENENTRKW